MSTDLAVQYRQDFPVLSLVKEGKSLVYLDNGATTQKPRVVADRMYQFYTQEYGTIHRGVYFLSQQATSFYDEVREKVATFLNASRSEEIIFTRGTTEAINLVASCVSRHWLKAGDEVIVTGMEHHANIVPWQEACLASGAVLKVVPITQAGELDMDVFRQLVSAKTKFVSVVHVSNALGTINPVKDIVDLAHSVGAKVLLDGAQAVSHMPIDVRQLDCDFYAFSSHKLFGPTGVGVLYGKYQLLDELPPYQTGGDMIETVTFDCTTYAKPPAKFEAGTPSIAEVIGLGAAIDYVTNVGFDFIGKHEAELLNYATQKLVALPGIRLIGTAREKASVLSFVIDGIHPHDVGTILDECGVAIRAGHHCAQPIMAYFGVPATNRASFSFYNTVEDVDRLVDAVRYCQGVML